MYVCMCHGITDGAVREAVCGGACSAKDVFKRLGVRPQCGGCAAHMSLLVTGADAAAPAEHQPSLG